MWPECASDERPERYARVTVPLEDSAEKNGDITEDGRKLNHQIVVWYVLVAHDGGDEGCERERVGEADRIVLDPASERGQVGECGFLTAEKGL